MYMIYFDCPLGDQDLGTSCVTCTKCCLGLHNWLTKQSSISFAVSMIWCELKYHCQNWYFCPTKIKSFSIKQRDKIAFRLSKNTQFLMMSQCHHQDGLDVIDCSVNSFSMSWPTQSELALYRQCGKADSVSFLFASRA